MPDSDEISSILLTIFEQFKTDQVLERVGGLMPKKVSHEDIVGQLSSLIKTIESKSPGWEYSLKDFVTYLSTADVPRKKEVLYESFVRNAQAIMRSSKKRKYRGPAILDYLKTTYTFWVTIND